MDWSLSGAGGWCKKEGSSHFYAWPAEQVFLPFITGVGQEKLCMTFYNSTSHPPRPVVDGNTDNRNEWQQ